MREQWEIEPGRILDAGDGRVVVLFHERGRSSAGLDVDEEHAELYTVDDGLIVRRQASSAAREAGLEP